MPDATPSLTSRWKGWARATKRDGIALYLAARDPRVPWAVKAFAAAVAAYAVSPIDLIPDFIPVLGLVDDLILVPLAVAVIVRWIDPAIMAEHRRAADVLAERPISWLGAGLIVCLWTLAACAIAWVAWPYISG